MTVAFESTDGGVTIVDVDVEVGWKVGMREAIGILDGGGTAAEVETDDVTAVVESTPTDGTGTLTSGTASFDASLLLRFAFVVVTLVSFFSYSFATFSIHVGLMGLRITSRTCPSGSKDEDVDVCCFVVESVLKKS